MIKEVILPQYPDHSHNWVRRVTISNRDKSLGDVCQRKRMSINISDIALTNASDKAFYDKARGIDIQEILMNCCSNWKNNSDALMIFI